MNKRADVIRESFLAGMQFHAENTFTDISTFDELRGEIERLISILTTRLDNLIKEEESGE